MMVVQFGLAMMPRGRFFAASGLISGTTSGTSGVHPEGGGVVDDHRAGGRGGGAEFLGNPAARAEERDVHARERIVREFLDHDVLAAECHRFPGRARRSQQLQLAEREIPLFEAKEHFHADGTRRARQSRRAWVRS